MSKIQPMRAKGEEEMRDSGCHRADGETGVTPLDD